ncbi:MAG: hypothetical protein R3E08_04120 [Thiotrichaceae bacterium]
MMRPRENADVGFSMGSGTEATKESSDIVILDDNFASITKAVLCGIVFKSQIQALYGPPHVNVCNYGRIFWAFLGFDLPIFITQLLWVNVIMIPCI